MIKKLNTLFVTLFGIGKINFAQGTLASFFTIVFLFYCFHIKNYPNEFILIFLLITFFYSFYAIAIYIRDSKNKDPKEIVIDEFIGQSIPIYLYEVGHNTEKLTNEALYFYIYIFILFRFFDIKKPFPINLFDKKFKNSFGVIFDDVIAGLYVVLTIIIFMILKSKLF